MARRTSKAEEPEAPKTPKEPARRTSVAKSTGRVASGTRKPARKKSSKKVDPTRLRLVWGVFDNSNQQVATFPYAQKADALQKAAHLTERGRGTYFVQPVKEPMPLEPAPASDASAGAK